MRMYSTENQNYQILAPWESKELLSKQSMVRTFQKPEFVVRNQDLTPREVRQVLPPLQYSGRVTMEQTRLLKERLGQLLYVARPDVINKLRKGMRASDQLKHGTIISSNMDEILKDHNVNLDEGTKRKLLAQFDPRGSGKIVYADLLEFMTDALDDYKVQRDKSEFNNMPRYPQRSRVRHPSMNSTDFNLAPLPKRGMLEEEYTEMPGAYSRVKLNNAFNERRDAGLKLEIERCCQEYRGDIFFVFYNLKKKLLSSEEDVINSYKLKSIVTRHQLPINDALVDKLIERLDPFRSGSVSARSFINFLEKSLPLPNGYSGSLSQEKVNKSSQKVPEKPKWEVSQPLKAIPANNGKAVKKSSPESNRDVNGQAGSKEFERFMKLVTALRRRSKGLDQLATEAAKETIVKYNALFSLGFTESEINSVLQRNEKDGYVEVDGIIDELGSLA